MSSPTNSDGQYEDTGYGVEYPQSPVTQPFGMADNEKPVPDTAIQVEDHGDNEVEMGAGAGVGVGTGYPDHGGYSPYNPMTGAHDFLAPPQATEELIPILGSPMLPLHIKVQREKEGKFWRILQAVQTMVWILVGLSMIMIFLITGPGGGASSSLLGSTDFRPVEKTEVKLADVRGCNEIRKELEYLIDYLKNPEKFTRMGITQPRGYLLEGPPGVGKTMLARAIAGEANVPMFAVSGSEFVEMYVGLGAARVRQLFAAARARKKAIIFIDEIDAMGGKRTGITTHSETRQTLNQLLTEMDGFKGSEGIIVMGATNTVQELDPALLRPGRFDHTFTLHLPDIQGRKEILESLFSKYPSLAIRLPDKREDIIQELAACTWGFSGAQLTHLVNQAKIFALRRDPGTSSLIKKDFDEARDFISMGPERSIVQRRESIKSTAYHESGHAIVGLLTKGAATVQMATIVPRGSALGFVYTNDDRENESRTKERLLAQLDVCFGGWVAERMLAGDKSDDQVSLGPWSDLNNANNVAHSIVMGGFGQRTKFLRPVSGSELSETSRAAMELDIQDLLDASRNRVAALLTKYRRAWIALAELLLKKETLDSKEIRDCVLANGVMRSELDKR